MVLHGVKKAVANVKGSNMPDNAEFTSLKAQLDGVYKFLETNNTNISELAGKWTALATDTKKMTENYASLYPDTDDTKAHAKEAAAAAAKAASKAASVDGPDSQVGLIVKTIKKYLTEISALNTEYTKLADQKVEYEMYKNKTEGLEGAKKKDADKIERNQGKTEAAKIAYEGTLDSLIVRMKSIFGKRAPVLKASMVAFWLAQSGHVSQLMGDYATPVEFAVAAGPEASALDIAAIKIENVTPEGAAVAGGEAAAPAPAPVAV